MRPISLAWLVFLVSAPCLVANCDDGGPGGTGGAPGTGGTTGLGGVLNMGGVPALGGTMDSGGTPATGGTKGTGGSTVNVNVHSCPWTYSESGSADICIGCDPLPAGSSDGCPPPLNCSDVDKTSSLRYPKGCLAVFPWQNNYWPDELQTAYCWDPPKWACQL